MLKKAHVPAGPAPEVGDETIALCGKEFTVEALWGDVPKKHPICRNCVDIALEAAAEADHLIRAARIDAIILRRTVTRLVDVLYPKDDLAIDTIVEVRQQWEDNRRLEAEAEAAERKAATTCTCQWIAKTFTPHAVDPDCPIHGGDDTPPSGEDDDGKGPRDIETTPEVP